ncbi:MAG TPA: SDR family oxidoreductase [Quisquiliibacterium sp.]|nr:SDR family oxidoreductase [Quisquiliibacterium sp.]
MPVPGRDPIARALDPQRPATWLVSGVAGFIGSNLLESLLSHGQHVVGVDNFATGFQRNLDEVQRIVGADAWRRFRFIEGDVRSEAVCAQATAGVDYVLHQAALGSVPRSIEQPLRSFDANVDGFVRLLTAARDAGVKTFVYASSSSVYGDSPVLPKVEDQIGKPLSPYAATKFVDEVFAGVYARTYRMRCIGLRYFNVFGARQDPDGAYAAVIPRWIAALLRGDPVYINGDGQTSRDFCHVRNAVQANVLAAQCDLPAGSHEVFNVAVGERTSLNELFTAIRRHLQTEVPALAAALDARQPEFRPFRDGDVRHSLADVSKAGRLLGYVPSHRLEDGLAAAMSWYVAFVR